MTDVPTPVNKTSTNSNYQMQVLTVLRPAMLDTYVRYKNQPLASNREQREATINEAINAKTYGKDLKAFDLGSPLDLSFVLVCSCMPNSRPGVLSYREAHSWWGRSHGSCS